MTIQFNTGVIWTLTESDYGLYVHSSVSGRSIFPGYTRIGSLLFELVYSFKATDLTYRIKEYYYEQLFDFR